MPFGDNCSVAVGNNYDTTGTLTRAKLSALSTSQIQALFTNGTTWNEMNSLLKHMVEMRINGVRRNHLYDWIMSSNKPGQGKLVTVQRAAKGPSMIQPFYLAAQKSHWNHDFWNVSANVVYDNTYTTGAANPLPTGPGGGTNRALRVTSPYGSIVHAGYFLVGKKLHHITRSVGGAFQITQFRIVQAAARAAGDYADVEAVIEQATTGTIASSSTATGGILLAGINNVNDVEAWCKNFHNVNTAKLVPIWYQTRRRARRIDSEYEKIFAKLMEDNAWFARFQDLPISERNRQDEAEDQKQFVNAFLFQERYSDNQTLDLWQNLPVISSVSGAHVDAGTSGLPIAYRANFVGVVPQLKACGQFIDSGNQDLEIKPFLENTIYDIHRARDSAGRPATDIDVYTSQALADQIMTAFIAYSKEKLGDIVRVNLEEGFTEWGFPFRRFRLYKPYGVTLNVMTAPAFDDLAAAAPSGQESLGNYLMILDLGSGGTIYPAVLASNRKQYTTGEIADLAKVDSTYACVMENPTIKTTLTSDTMAVIVETPKNSLVQANMATIKHTPA